ncbi:MAG: glycine zipper family protein, partial [Methylococcaceae bacterium]|nr:glycine zipper family protein [Methylococcaceae bacterium]
MSKHLKYFAFPVLLAVGGCASMPTGPSVLVLPGTGKSFEQFRVDDFVCRQYIQDLMGGVTPSAVASEAAITHAAVGTALGAAAGAAIGGGQGAAIGAGSGLAAGTLAGAG